VAVPKDDSDQLSNHLSSLNKEFVKPTPADLKQLDRFRDSKVDTEDLLDNGFYNRGLRWIEILKPRELKACVSPDLYHKLSTDKLLSPHEQNILKDINRTFPSHRLFNEPCNGKQRLFNVLKAYSIYDSDVGYSQGMAFLVGFLLLHLSDEEDVFWCFVRMMHSPKYNLRSLYQNADCLLLKLLLAHFDKLLAEYSPEYFNYLHLQGVDASMYATQWICTLFAYRFEHEFVALVWERFFRHGLTVVFQVGLSLMAHLEETLMKLPFEQLVPVLSRLPPVPQSVVKRSHKIKISKQLIDTLLLVEFPRRPRAIE